MPYDKIIFAGWKIKSGQYLQLLLTHYKDCAHWQSARLKIMYTAFISEKGLEIPELSREVVNN